MGCGVPGCEIVTQSSSGNLILNFSRPLKLLQVFLFNLWSAEHEQTIFPLSYIHIELLVTGGFFYCTETNINLLGDLKKKKRKTNLSFDLI